MTDFEERKARVAAGSKRQRDLDAVGAADRPKPLAETYAGWMRWAKANLPSEYGPFVAVAARMLKRSGTKPTAENVKARLEQQGRTKAQLDPERKV